MIEPADITDLFGEIEVRVQEQRLFQEEIRGCMLRFVSSLAPESKITLLLLHLSVLLVGVAAYYVTKLIRFEFIYRILLGKNVFMRLDQFIIEIAMVLYLFMTLQMKILFKRLDEN